MQPLPPHPALPQLVRYQSPAQPSLGRGQGPAAGLVVDIATARHLATSYGDRSMQVLQLAEERGLGRPLVAGHPILEAEVVYCVRVSERRGGAGRGKLECNTILPVPSSPTWHHASHCAGWVREGDWPPRRYVMLAVVLC